MWKKRFFLHCCKVPYCILIFLSAETYPNYEVVVSIDHLYEGFTVNCADEYTDSLDTALSTFADDISELCNGMIWDLTRQSSDHSQVSNEVNLCVNYSGHELISDFNVGFIILMALALT